MQPTDDRYVLELLSDLERHPVNSNSFFLTFEREHLTIEQLRAFVSQYHYFCKHFVKLLEGLLYHTPVDEVDMRIELTKTLFSELGNGRRDGAHITLLTRFTRALGMTEAELSRVTPIPAVWKYMETLRRLFMGSGYLAALGAETSVEVTAASEFRYLYPGLKKYRLFKDDDLIFFKLHLNEEEFHGQWLLQAVQQTARSEQERLLVRSAALETANAWHAFWLGLDAAVLGRQLEAPV